MRLPLRQVVFRPNRNAVKPSQQMPSFSIFVPHFTEHSSSNPGLVMPGQAGTTWELTLYLSQYPFHCFAGHVACCTYAHDHIAMHTFLISSPVYNSRCHDLRVVSYLHSPFAGRAIMPFNILAQPRQPPTSSHHQHHPQPPQPQNRPPKGQPPE